MAIVKLPKEVRSAVRNGISIASTAQCVAELVYNSLDAEADSVIIHLDVPRFKLQVFDNGSGIAFENLKHVGIRYNTSKCRSLSDIQSNLKYYGYRGEALASLCASSGTVIILTRPRNEGLSYCKTFSNGKPHHPSKSITNRTCPGTTVTVQDFMYNAPVRQQRIKPNIDVEEIRMQVEALALAHPNVSFTIKDESDNSTVLNVARSQCTLETFSKLYGDEITSHLCPIGPHSSGKHKIYGFISTSSHHNKRLQFIFVNGKLVKRTKVHKLINMIMRKSDVLRGNGPWQELPLPERVRDFLWVSPTKKKDRHCVFLINIDCPLIEYDITLDPKKTLIEFRDWDSLLESTETLVKDFLKRHNLACVASDPEMGESGEESSSSVLKEVGKLDDEDSVGHKLDQFKHDAVKQSEMRTFTSRTICSMPAKRYISNQKKNNNSKKSTTPMKDGKPVDKKNEIESTVKANQTDIRSNPIINPVQSKIADDVDLTKCQSLIDKNSNASLNSAINEFKRKTHEHAISLTNGCSSLGRFRNLFSQGEMLPQKTPADIQHIKIEEPPPIIKRKAPLEYRIQALMESEQLKASHPKTVATNNVVNASNTENDKSQRSCPSNDFTYDEKLSNINKVVKYVPVTLSNDTSCNYSDYFKKTHPTTSIATQTASDVISLEGQHTERMNFSHKKFNKPNLKNISERIKQFKETLSLPSETSLLKNYLESKESNNILNIQEINELDCFNSIQKSDGDGMPKTSKEPSTEEVDSNFLSSDDFLFSIGNQSETVETDAMTELKNDAHIISNETVTTSVSESLTPATDSINNLVSDKIGQQFEEVYADYDSRSDEVISQEFSSVAVEQNYLNQPKIDLNNHSGLDPSETVLSSSVSYVNNEISSEKVSDHNNACQQMQNKSLEEPFCEKTLSDKILNSNIDAVVSFVDQNDALTEIENDSDASPGSITVKYHDCFKVSQKRSSNSDEEMDSIIKKKRTENTDLDSDQQNFLVFDQVGSTECMDSTVHLLSNNCEGEINSHDSVSDVIPSKIPKGTESIENKSLPVDCLYDCDMNEMENNNPTVSENPDTDVSLLQNNEKSINKNNDLLKSETFEMFARQPFLPKGLSPIMTKDSAKLIRLGKAKTRYLLPPLTENSSSGKKLSTCDEFVQQITSFQESSETNVEKDTKEKGFISSYLLEMQNKKYIAECKVLSAYDSNQTKSIMKIYNLIYPCTFSKKVLTSFKMLGKLDDKFIVAQINIEKGLGSGTIVLFDQHAVHERIRLEKLMKEYTAVNKEEGDCNSTYVKYKSVAMVPSFEITASSAEIRIMEKFPQLFERLGISFERSPGKDLRNDEVVISITAVPACLSSKDAKELGPLGLKERIHALIREQTESLVITRGLGTSSPGVLRDAINMEACRGAVKFGDTLSDRQCRWLLRNLAKCDSPFQCAHGRPSMYPIAAISHLEKHWSETELEKPSIWKIKKLMELHP